MRLPSLLERLIYGPEYIVTKITPVTEIFVQSSIFKGSGEEEPAIELTLESRRRILVEAVLPFEIPQNWVYLLVGATVRYRRRSKTVYDAGAGLLANCWVVEEHSLLVTNGPLSGELYKGWKRRPESIEPAKAGW